MGRRASAKDRVTIKIPRELYDRLAEIIEPTGFGSVSGFVVHVMRDIAAGGKLREDEPAGELTAREVEMVRKRLKALGYLK